MKYMPPGYTIQHGPCNMFLLYFILRLALAFWLSKLPNLIVFIQMPNRKIAIKLIWMLQIQMQKKVVIESLTR